jgi:hypothetical protein
MVGEEGIEPSIREEHDFESCAYTSSATRPYRRKPLMNTVGYRG